MSGQINWSVPSLNYHPVFIFCSPYKGRGKGNDFPKRAKGMYLFKGEQVVPLREIVQAEGQGKAPNPVKAKSEALCFRVQA